MEKTAMQIAIEWVNDNYPKFNHHEIEAKLTELRDTVEKEQIQGAYKKGCFDTYGNDEPNPDDPKDDNSATDYYNQTYKP